MNYSKPFMIALAGVALMTPAQAETFTNTYVRGGIGLNALNDADNTGATGLSIESAYKNGFTITYARRALFCPPYRNTTFFLKTAGLFEYFGRRLLPFLNGVYIIEAVKKTYAGTPVKDKPSLTPPLWSPFGKLVTPVSNRTQNSRTSNP